MEALKRELERLRRADPWQALQLAPQADTAAVRAAFLEATKRYHPNRYARESAEVRDLANEIFLAVRKAYEGLRDGRVVVPTTAARPGVANGSAPASQGEHRSAGPVPATSPGPAPAPAPAQGQGPAPPHRVSSQVPVVVFGGVAMATRGNASRLATQPGLGTARPPTPGSGTAVHRQPTQPPRSSTTTAATATAKPPTNPPRSTTGPQPAVAAPPARTPTPGKPIVPPPGASTTPPRAGAGTPRRVTSPQGVPVLSAAITTPRMPGSKTREEVEQLLESVKTRGQRLEKALAILADGKAAEARVALQQLILEDPQNKRYRAHLHHAWGLEYKAAGKHEEAIRELERAVSLDASLEDAARELGRLQAQRKSGGGFLGKLFGR